MHFNLKHKLVSDPLWEPTNPNSIKDYSLLDGTWCYPQNFNKFKASLIEDFRIKSVSKQFLNARAYVLEKECCSIHVRRGDYLKPKAKLKYRTLDQDYYRLAMNYIEQSANVECYIVFTNDIDWCKSNLKSDKPLLYINELFKLTDYEELHVMALCKHNIIANSTFSWWAAYLNENAEKTVIKPRIWYTLDVAQHAYENKGLLSLEGSINL